MLRKLYALKDKLFSPRYLLLTNVALGSNMLTAADLVQQKIEHISSSDLSKNQIDYNRSTSMLKTGACFGVAGHYWYKYLDSKFVGSSFKMIKKKLLCEMIAGPPFAYVFFILVGFFENKSIQQSWSGFKQNILYICLADWLFYIPIQGLNFYFLPAQFRFLVVCSITFIYDIFLSFVLHRDVPKF